MKTFLEHTRDQQDEGLKDMAKKGLEKAKGMMKPKAGGDKKPGMMDRIKAGAKRVVQAVGREFEKGRQSAGAPKPAEKPAAKPAEKPAAKPAEKKKEGPKTKSGMGIAEIEPTDNKVDATGDAFEKKDKDAKIKKKEEEREEEQRRLEAGYAPLPVDQR